MCRISRSKKSPARRGQEKENRALKKTEAWIAAVLPIVQAEELAKPGEMCYTAL